MQSVLINGKLKLLIPCSVQLAVRWLLTSIKMVPIGPLAPWNKLNRGSENQTLVTYFHLLLCSPKKMQAFSVSLTTICEFEIWGDISCQHGFLWTCSKRSCRLLLRPISQSIFLNCCINVQYLLPLRTSIIQNWISFLNSNFCAVIQLSAPYILFNLWCMIGLSSPLAGYDPHSSTSRDPADHTCIMTAQPV